MKALLALLLLLAPFQAQATIRSLFVGIDKYRFSMKHNPENAFEDLQGAVSDVARIKAALKSAYGIDTGPATQGRCPSGIAVSITLTDECATKLAIVDALKGQIAAAAKGDTLIFFYAGHGAQTDDGSIKDQISGHNDTILPVDARDPDAVEQGDILDHDLRVLINGAVAKGVNFVSIFDSCHSGTAVRGSGPIGRKRRAPPLPVPSDPPEVSIVPGPGYWVHLAASTDDEESYEIDLGGGRHGGVFTDALVKTIAQPRLAGSTFGDIATAVQLAVRDAGRTDQHPQIEGALNATLGGGDHPVSLFDARPDGATARLSIGKLAGVTAGSVYALFPDRGRAIATAPTPVATGRVTAVDDYGATLTLDRAVGGTATLKARETDHAYGDRQLRLGLLFPTPDLSAAVAQAIRPLPFVTMEGPPQIVASRPGRTGPLEVHMASGSAVGMLPPVDDPGFAGALASMLQRVARVQAMMALRTDPTRDDVDFCIDGLPNGAAPCAPVTGSHGRVFATGQPIRVRVFNATDRPRHFYVYGIDQENNVSQILPVVGATDEPLPPRRMLPQNQSIRPRTPGNYLFMVIASDAPIDGAALEQRGGARDAGACASTLARLLCDAKAGTRDATLPTVGAWSALVLPARVVFPDDPLLKAQP